MTHHAKYLNDHIQNVFHHYIFQILIWLILCVTTNSYASDNDLSKYFDNKTGCFILYDLTHNKFIEHYNAKRCAKRIAADSTFKVALSLMAFDQNLITQNTVFKWDGQHRAMDQWNHNQTPKTWIQYSVAWVSQQLTPQLGAHKIIEYLKTFHYGNADFTGNPGKNDGLTQAWLSSSLKISADEQLKFLISLVSEKLSVSHTAMKYTKDNMFIQNTNNGTKLYGKTGSGNSPDKLQEEGWFVGFTQSPKQQYIIVTNVSFDKRSSNKFGGYVAKKITTKILQLKHLLNAHADFASRRGHASQNVDNPEGRTIHLPNPNHAS